MSKNNGKIGRFLGYPPCCIEAFGVVAVFFKDRPTIVQQAAKNNYIPCMECAIRLLADEETYNTLINKNRHCSIPFKEEHTKSEAETIDLEIDMICRTNWNG